MEITPDSTGTEKQTVEQIISSRAQIQSELAKVIVGQKEVIEQLLIALFAGGHCDEELRSEEHTSELQSR